MRKNLLIIIIIVSMLIFSIMVSEPILDLIIEEVYEFNPDTQETADYSQNLKYISKYKTQNGILDTSGLSKSYFLIYWVIANFSVAIVIMIVKIIADKKKNKEYQGKTMGTIVELCEGYTDSRRFSYSYPVVEYEVNGITYRKKHTISTNSFWNPKVGEQVSIIYDENNPDKWTSDVHKKAYRGYYLFIGVALFILFSVLIMSL